MNLVIFGPPGAGKGTQSKFVVKKYNLFQLSTGELLRTEINKKSKLGNEISSIINSGKLVSDDIVSNLIEKFVSEEKFKNKLIFDGYPRNISQAKNLDILLKKYNQKIDLVLKDSDHNGKPDMIGRDTNGDGKPDLIAVDKGENGSLDIWYVDTNYDGKVDVSGIDTNGDGKPDKFKKIS